MKRLWKKGEPIIGSILEIDVYKITMLYFIWRFFPFLEVAFTFKNRNPKLKLAELIGVEQLKEEFRHVQHLRFTDGQLSYLRKWQLFPEGFIQALKTMSLPEPDVKKGNDGQFDIRVAGPWFHVTFWELFILPIVSELSTRAQLGESDADHARCIQEGERRLMEKIAIFKKLRWSIALFGLRRRASGLWERRTTDILLNEIEQKISGISNVQIAKEYDLEPIGTNAHELAMALYALRRHECYDAAWQSQYEVLEKWQQLYGHKLKIMLPDTFGSEQFFTRLPVNFLRDWRGSRQDSGDPFVYGENRIKMYQDNGIDPTEKLAFFTDGLTPEKMVKLDRQFFGRIGGGFGVGTNISNDLGLMVAPAVMKLTEAAGNPAVKLSDNLSKAIGEASEVLVAKKIFGYANTFNEACVY